MLVATGTGKRIRIGDEVRVQVEEIDAPRGRVNLLPVTL
jgi:ribonuclease R